MNHKLPRWVTLLAVGALVFLYVPMLTLAVYSFNSAPRELTLRGLTLRWYAQVFADPDMLAAAWNTLVLAVVSTTIATVLGTMLAVGLDRYPWPRWVQELFDGLLHLPVVTPDLILAAALLVALGLLAHLSPLFAPGMTSMVLGHVTFEIPFVALVVRSRLALVGHTVDEAARDLYAGTPRLLTKVTLPLLWPGVVAGAMLAFTLSLDDFIIAFFTCGNRPTLPVLIYAELRKGVTTATAALSTLLFAATVVLVLGLQVLASLRKT